jgi:DNA-binding NarL/FixJ family response regulator
MAIRVLSVDDHPVLRDGIGALISNHTDVELVGEAANGHEALAQFRRIQPDVTLMDLQMPMMDGVETIGRIRAEYPAAKIIVLTTFAGDVLARRALKAGAVAYVLKTMVRRELLETIRAVHRGLKRVQDNIADDLAQHTGEPMLTSRELDVLKLAADGYTNSRIAESLNIKDETVKAHMSSILGKLGARDRTHAVTLALRRGVIAL